MNAHVLAARRDRDLTQEDLAAAVELNKADIVRIERHGWIPPREVRLRIAKTLKSTEDRLFGQALSADHR